MARGDSEDNDIAPGAAVDSRPQSEQQQAQDARQLAMLVPASWGAFPLVYAAMVEEMVSDGALDKLRTLLASLTVVDVDAMARLFPATPEELVRHRQDPIGDDSSWARCAYLYEWARHVPDSDINAVGHDRWRAAIDWFAGLGDVSAFKTYRTITMCWSTGVAHFLYEISGLRFRFEIVNFVWHIAGRSSAPLTVQELVEVELGYPNIAQAVDACEAMQANTDALRQDELAEAAKDAMTRYLLYRGFKKSYQGQSRPFCRSLLQSKRTQPVYE
jgi:hypothetical protein